MEKEIIKKHGIKFLDSIKNCADKQFVINNPNQIFSIEECDEAKTYPNPKKSEDFWDIPSKEFNAKFTYPKNYVECKKEYDNIMDAKFILYKNGAIDSLKIESDNPNGNSNIGCIRCQFFYHPRRYRRHRPHLWQVEELVGTWQPK